MPFRSFVLAFLVLPLSWAVSVNSATAQAAKPDKMVRVTYPVGDLLERPANLEPKVRAENLVRAIADKVAPQSWEAVGGPGNIQYFPFGEAIVVNQSLAVQEEITAFLAKLRAAEPKKQPNSKRQTIENRLREPITFQLKDVPLEKALEGLSQMSGMPIMLDRKALRDARIDLDAPITFQASEMAMWAALNSLLSDLDLQFTVENQVLMITTKTMGGGVVRRTYFVADLLEVRERVEKKKADPGALKCLIEETVAKNSWEYLGGAGTIKYSPKEKCLVVSQSLEVHEEIELLLATIRKLCEVTVDIDTRAVIVSAKTAKQFRKTLAQQGKSVDVVDGEKSPALVSIDDAQLRQLLDFAETDRVAHVMQAPKTSFFNGQTLKGGVPESMPDGMKFDYRPVVSPDRGSVRLEMTFAHWKTADSVRRITQATKKLSLPDGRTLAWDLGEIADRHHLFVFVTSKIRVLPEPERVFLGEIPSIPR